MKKRVVSLICCVVLAACGGQAQNKQAQTTKTMDAETITLAAPQESGATLMDALEARASVRSYSDEGLTLEQLSGIMWAAAGQTRPDGKLTAPSAMALYPIKVYAVIPNGIYLYDSKEHKLTLVKKGDYMKLTGLQDFVYTAPLNIMYIADLDAYAERLGNMSEADKLRLCALDAAGYCQNANLWAAGYGMGAVTRGGAHGPEFLKTIEAPESYRFILAQTVGIPK